MSGLHIPATLERRVRERAGDRCEYCRLAQRGQEATFHVDHVFPRKNGGQTTWDNLALACVSCSLRKGARTNAADPVTDEVVAIFDPRKELWENHFEVLGDFTIRGKTSTGRATVELLKLNRSVAMSIRYEESIRGRYA